MSSLFFDAGPSASGQKVMLATTVYDSPDASYTFSMARTREAMHKAGIPTAYLLLQGNCHVDDGRNTVVRDFLKSDCTDLVFLDADVSWRPDDLIKLCRYERDVVGGVYPYRRDDGNNTMPYRPLPGLVEMDEDGLLEVEGLPTGFLRIRRPVLEMMAKSAAHFAKDNDNPVPLIFERDIYGGGRRGGDINFCMKWRELGGRLYAAADIRLGHCGKQVIHDSLAALIRRQGRTTLRYVAGLIREGRETKDTFAEALRAIDNNWGAQTDVLSLAVLLARKAQGPIIEVGSGLSTVLMAAATDQQVWCIEHNPFFAGHLEAMAALAGVSNIIIVSAPLKDGWYDLSDDLEVMPKSFALGFVDGPPRHLGDRMRFFDLFGAQTDVILADDANDLAYAGRLRDWAGREGRTVEIDDRAAVVLKRAA